MSIQRAHDSKLAIAISGGFLIVLIVAGVVLGFTLDGGDHSAVFEACLTLLPLFLVAAMIDHDWRRYGTSGTSYLVLVGLYFLIALIGLVASIFGLENVKSDSAVSIAVLSTGLTFFLLVTAALLRARGDQPAGNAGVSPNHSMKGRYKEERSGWIRTTKIDWKYRVDPAPNSNCCCAGHGKSPASAERPQTGKIGGTDTNPEAPSDSSSAPHAAE